MTVCLGLLVVVAELYNHVVAGLHLLEHLVPASFVEETERRPTVDGMIVHHDVVIKIALQSHAPSAFERTFREVFLCSC